jgi:hypothetical protein
MLCNNKLREHPHAEIKPLQRSVHIPSYDPRTCAGRVFAKRYGRDEIMLKSRLLVGILLTAFAVGSTTGLAFAKTKGKHPASVAAENGIPVCGHGMVPEWHDRPMTAHPHWHCVKVS